MSYDEAVIEDIKADLNHLDETTLQSIREIIDRAKRPRFLAPEAERRSTVPLIDIEEPLPFVGENWTLEEFERLSPEERAMRKWRLKEKNQDWLQEQFSTLSAAWVVVVGGKVVASGRNLKKKPLPPQLLKICRRTGKFPFVFVNDRFIAIEESASTWQKTILTDDYYPTLSIIFNSASGIVEVVGDFDTGCSHTFVDYNFLADQKIIQRETIEDFEKHQHLNRDFIYVDKPVRVELPINSSATLILNTLISCVPNWNFSPFVALNPNRTALIGRDILLELKPQVLLDFAKRQTEIVTAMKTRRTHKKSGQKKKRAPRRRRRA